MKMLIVTDEGENVVIAGMPANKAINKRYKCIICPKCRCYLQHGQSAYVENYYNMGDLNND